MLKLAIAGAMALALPVAAQAPALPPNSTPYSSGIPPVRYQGDRVSIVVTVSDVSKYCGQSDKPEYRIIACSGWKDGNPVMIMPNPCQLADVEFYARIMCHEAGHLNGWARLHGD